MDSHHPVASAKDAIAELDAKAAWADLPSKDVPTAITSYVSEALRTQTVDEVRLSLGMRAMSDIRWRKIMTALRTGTKIDSTAIFLQWLERNQRLAEKLDLHIETQLKLEMPFSKMTFEAINTIATLQANTVKLGKELGVFSDPSDQGKGSGGVTIVVQTHVPSPSREVIIEHQRARQEKNQQLLDQHKPEPKESTHERPDPV